jgi:hypothetical protein
MAMSGSETACRDANVSVEVFDTASKRARLLDAGEHLSPPDPVTPPDPIRLADFPLAGLTASDVIRVNLFLAPPDPFTPSSACTVQAAVEAPPATCIDSCAPTVLNQNTVTLNPGQGMMLSYSDATISTRKMVQPVLRNLRCAGCSMPPGCRSVVSTVELMDSSGRTFVLSPEAPVQ